VATDFAFMRPRYIGWRLRQPASSHRKESASLILDVNRCTISCFHLHPLPRAVWTDGNRAGGRAEFPKGAFRMAKTWVSQDPKQLEKHGADNASHYVGWVDPEGKRKWAAGRALSA
jgi:hypothetical protein